MKFFGEVFSMSKRRLENCVSLKCPISGFACINCSLYRGRHFNLCFQDHFRGDDSKGTGPIMSMGYLASGGVVKGESLIQIYRD